MKVRWSIRQEPSLLGQAVVVGSRRPPFQLSEVEPVHVAGLQIPICRINRYCDTLLLEIWIQPELKSSTDS